MTIKFNNLYTYKKLKRDDGDGNGRVYVDDAGNKIPSVTTILSKTKDTSHLIAWRKRIGEDKAKQITEESAGLGTTVHAHLEAYLLGQERPGGNNYGRLMAKRMADTVIQNGFLDVDEVWGVESHLNYETMWAGTTDCVGVFKGKPAIIDFKTTNKPKKIEWIEDYFLQLCAYSLAHDKTFGTNIDRAVIFMCARDCTYQQFEIGGYEMEEYKVKWCNKVSDYYTKYVFKD